jgi:putative transposase
MRRRHQQLDFAGSIHFVTTVTRQRGSWFVTESRCLRMLHAFEKCRVIGNTECLGYALMPDHFHVLLRQLIDGSLVPDLMGSFKRETSKIPGIDGMSAYTLWRDRYDDVPIPGPRAVKRRLEYMHGNPVRGGLVLLETDYPWSSARFYAGLVDKTEILIVKPEDSGRVADIERIGGV